ncbi:hypothetical protein ACFYO1_33645 [Nocardia sp. NPDC006044]|uniref:hypothetical protein n=1 Tax=Nocardia sp. NPDC006044 TaxID=3364306 RepID=UPI0036B0D7D1
MTYRLGDIDCVSARGHSALGGTLAIQAVWHYDRPVDTAALADFHAALRHGRLGRVVAAAMIPAAGDRWSARAEFAPLEASESPIPRGELEAWIDAQGRAELRTFGGPAWRLSATACDNGESAVSLLASHTIADGRAFCAAIAEAVADKRFELSYPTDEFGRMRLLFGDFRDAARRGGALVKAAGLAVQLALGRRGDTPAARGADQDFRLPTVDATIPAQHWHAAARDRGGSATTLAVAVTAALATEIGRTDEQGRARMMMPVSTRAEADERANALASIDFEVDLRAGPLTDLAPLRTLMKEKLNAAVTGERPVAPLIPVAVALPRRLFGVLVRKVAADATVSVCSNLGELDPQMLRVDGRPASKIRLGLVNQSLDSQAVLTERGGNLYVSLFESDGRITIRFNGFHPPKLVDNEKLAEVVQRVLAGYGLTAILE